MKNNILTILIIALSSISQAEYIAKVPLEQSTGGSLPNNSIVIGVGGSSGSGSGNDDDEEGGGSTPTTVCNYAGNRSDGLPNYNGYSYHHIEYWTGAYNTVWYNNNYIGQFTDAQLADTAYSRGALITVGGTPGQNYYELCVETSGTN